MKRIKLFLILFLIIGLFFGLKNFKNKETNKNDVEKQKYFKVMNDGMPLKTGDKLWSENRVIVKFKKDISDLNVKATFLSYQLREIRRIPNTDSFICEVKEGYTIEEVISALKYNIYIEYAEPDGIAYALTEPNDPYFDPYQYALYNYGQDWQIGEGKSGADIKAYLAWDKEKGKDTVTIAIVDTGVDKNHPDLKNKIVPGYKYVEPESTDPQDDHWHGTHVAGIAAASTNNGIGIAGVAWDSKIMPIKVLDKEGSGRYSWIALGIRFAADRGAKVINLSLGGSLPSPTLEEAVNYAVSKGSVVIAASGNESAPTLYPAAYKNCIAVAATDDWDVRTSWSNYGPEVDVAAPGYYILSAIPLFLVSGSEPPYAFASGTSMSAPHVSGLAALILSKNPKLKPSDIMNIIRYSADDINSINFRGVDQYLGYGRINSKTAIWPIILK
ncbi:MAG: S8 family peptidase [Acidobacteriota bacterium]